MQIVTDTGMDMYLPAEQMPEIDIHIVRHTITLNGKTYHSGGDIQSAELQEMLLKTSSFPITSQPAPGDFVKIYQRLAKTDPDILSIHMSSGLSGTYNAAVLGAQMVPEARVKVVDTKTLCAVLGWQVAAAARALKAGQPVEKILAVIERIGAASESIYTIDDLKYLIHGGRIRHMKGLIASMLRLRPLIGVEKVGGTYSQLGTARTFEKALKRLVDLVASKHAPGSALRVQVLHSYNHSAADLLHEMLDKTFRCTWMPQMLMSAALSAHTGPTMVGIAHARAEVFEDLP